MLLRTIGNEDQLYAEQEATPAALRAALAPDELWYGSEVELLPDDPAAPYLNAVSVAERYVTPAEPGEFLLGFAQGEAWYAETNERRFTRNEVLAYFLRSLAGDHEWIETLAWAEYVDGKRTGRIRERAI